MYKSLLILIINKITIAVSILYFVNCIKAVSHYYIANIN